MDSRKMRPCLAPATNANRLLCRSESSLTTLMEERNWDGLPMDCLVNILGRVGMESLLLDVPFVCQSWREASRDPSCWECLDFSEMGFDSIERLMEVYRIARGRFDVTAFIKSVVNRSCKNATKLIPPSSYTEEALKYAADECPDLRILDLPEELCYGDRKHILELMGKWKNLERLVLGHSDNLKKILPQISEHCKNFKEIEIYRANIDKEAASAIVTCLPNIKRLLLSGAPIDRENLMTILQGCKELVHLDVSDCVGFEADAKILELASHIHTFKYEGSSRGLLGEYLFSGQARGRYASNMGAGQAWPDQPSDCVIQ